VAYATPSPNTEYGKELAKWEMRQSRFTNDDVPPGRANVPFQEYPKMLFRAVKHPKTGQTVCIETPPNPMLYDNPQAYERACAATEQLNRDCCKTVLDDVAERNAKNEGWRNSPAEALIAHEERMCAIAEETARRHYSDRSMSPEAQAEAARVDDSTEHQVPDVQTEMARQKARK